MDSQPAPQLESVGVKHEAIYNFLPRCWKLIYWTATGILMIPGTIYVGLAIINPYWFREKMLDSTEMLLNYLSNIRYWVMKPALDKYCLLESIKQGQNILDR